MEESFTNKTATAFEEAKDLIAKEAATCVIIKNDNIIHCAKGPGIAPLIGLYENNPELLKDSFVVDKVIGKAAAMMSVLGGAKKVYGVLMSKAGFAYLNEHHVEAEYGKCVAFISNRTKDGLCPLEKTVLDVSDESEAYYLLKDTISKLMQAKAKA